MSENILCKNCSHVSNDKDDFAIINKMKIFNGETIAVGLCNECLERTKEEKKNEKNV